MDISKARNSMELRFPSKPENVAFARTVVAVFASQLDFTLDELDELKVATSEAVSNAVIHGYRDAEGDVRVEGRIGEDWVCIIVEDKGPGIQDVELACQPTYTTLPEERMGLGLTFIKEYTDELQIESAPGKGTILRMVKYLKPRDVSE